MISLRNNGNFNNNKMPHYGQNVPIDYGAKPFVTNIKSDTLKNDYYRTSLWTGTHLQLTLMSIKPKEDIGLEMHDNVDQFLKVEQGSGIVAIGKTKDSLNSKYEIHENYAVFIPAGTWHNIYNTGNVPLKLYSIYAPVQHPYNTVQNTKK